MSVRVLSGDCRTVLPTLSTGSVQCCVTSPPYYGLRDYGVAGQIGLEPTPDAYVAEMVSVFREVRRVLADDGTLWLNLGDSYASPMKGSGGTGAASGLRNDGRNEASRIASAKTSISHQAFKPRAFGMGDAKPKDLLGIPWMVAFALRADGWYLRSDIIWHKPNPMPESVTDRPTSAHEHVFLLSKSERYFYDAEAIAEERGQDAVEHTRRYAASPRSTLKLNPSRRDAGVSSNTAGFISGATRNTRNVWTIATQPFSGAHFATMPPSLVEQCIRAGTKLGDTVLDPFGGAGTTGLVADRLGRDAVLVELNPDYAALGRNRITGDAPLFGSVAAE